MSHKYVIWFSFFHVLINHWRMGWRILDFILNPTFTQKNISFVLLQKWKNEQKTCILDGFLGKDVWFYQKISGSNPCILDILEMDSWRCFGKNQKNLFQISLGRKEWHKGTSLGQEGMDFYEKKIWWMEPKIIPIFSKSLVSKCDWMIISSYNVWTSVVTHKYIYPNSLETG